MMKSSRTLIILGCVSLCVLISLALYLLVGGGRFFSTTPSHSFTILTAPVPTLPPHTHKADSTGLDSVLSAGHGKFVSSGRYVIPFDMWVTGISLTTKNAPHAVLHHLVMFKADYPNMQCSNRDEELYTTGADSRPDARLPVPYGFFLKKGTELYLEGMIHNPAAPRGPGGTYTDVSIGYTLTYELPNPSRTKPLAFYRLFVSDDDHCKDPLQTEDGEADVFTVPARAQHYVKRAATTGVHTQGRMTFTEPGLVIGVGGHLHEEDGGQYVELLKNDTVTARLTPEPAGDKPWQWQIRPDTHAFRIAPGDVVSVQAVYTNPYNFPLTDAMGNGALFFAPDDSSSRMR